MKNHYSYIWIINGIPEYVGKGTHKASANQERCLKHITTQPKTYWERRLSKAISCGIELEVVTVDHLTEQAAFDEEKRLIDLYGRLDLKTGTLYNFTNGGEGAAGRKVSKQEIEKRVAKLVGQIRTPEQRARMSAAQQTPEMIANRLARKYKPMSSTAKAKLSEAMKGFKHSDEARRKISEAGKKRMISPSTRALISASHSGKTVSVETRKKLSDSHIGYKAPPAQIEAMKKSQQARWDSMSDEKRIAHSNKAKEAWVLRKAKCLLQ